MGCRFLPVFLSILFLSACSAAQSQESEKDLPVDFNTTPFTIELFAAHGFLGGTEYERYYLADNIIWRECGAIDYTNSNPRTEPLSGDNVLAKDPNLRIQERRVDLVNRKDQIRLKAKIVQLLKAVEAAPATPFPGPFVSLTDPGTLELTVRMGERREKILTSVEAVADKESQELLRIYDLFAAVRAVGPTICTSTSFFGVGRSAL